MDPNTCNLQMHSQIFTDIIVYFLKAEKRWNHRKGNNNTVYNIFTFELRNSTIIYIRVLFNDFMLIGFLALESDELSSFLGRK